MQIRLNLGGQGNRLVRAFVGIMLVWVPLVALVGSLGASNFDEKRVNHLLAIIDRLAATVWRILEYQIAKDIYRRARKYGS